MGSFLRKIAIGLLTVLVLLIGPLALVAGLTAPRATNPQVVAEVAIEAGVLDLLYGDMLEGFAANMGPEDGPPPEELRILLERHFPQWWFEVQVRSLARQMAAWDPDDPKLVVDLRSVKASILADPEAVEMIVRLASSAPDDGPLAELPEITAETLEEVIPEELVLVGSQHPDRIASVTSTAENLRRTRLAGWAVLGVAALLTGLLLLVVRARMAWLGAILVLVAVPGALIASVVPAVAQRAVPALIPEQPPETYRTLAVFLEQLLAPVSIIALVLGAIGAALLVIAVRRGPRRQPAIAPEPAPAP